MDTLVYADRDEEEWTD